MRVRIFVLFTVFAFINYYLFIRGWEALPQNGYFHGAYIFCYLLFSTSFFIGMLFGNKMPLFLGMFFENIGAFWMISLLYMIFAALFTDLLRLGNYFLGIFPHAVMENYTIAKFLYFISLLFIWLIIYVIGYLRFINPQVVPLHLDIDKNSDHPEKLSIVAASDIHLGAVIRRRRLEKYVELINSQNPDIILFAGDLFDHNLFPVEAQRMHEILAKLKAKYGVYAILGNHDYYANAVKAAKYLEKSGINVLADQSVVIDDRFVLVGRKDYSQHNRMPLEKILNGINKSLPVILLDHQPINLTDAIHNKVDVQLSGHTHNGQIFPINLIVSKIFELAYGYRKIEDTHFYVSSGLGLWGAPIRLGTQSEIVNMKLHFRG
jgi:uncharacterized protein